MSDDATMRQAEKLIGGWVAGTLTASERALLLQASLANQTLFDALADEEGLRELLADPQVRRELAAVLAARSGEHSVVVAPESWWRNLFKPAPMAAFSAGVLAVIAFIVVRPEFFKRPQQAAVSSPAQVLGDAATAPASADEAPKASERERSVPRERRAAAPKSPSVARKDAGPPADKKEALAETASTAAPASEPPPMPAVTPYPAPPAAQMAAPAPPAAVVAESRAEESKAKRAAAAPAKLAAPPIRYRVERLQQAGGEWVEFGGELSQGTQARLAIELALTGMLTVRSNGEVLNVPARAGQRVYYPASGFLPAGPGEREIAILFRPMAMGALAQVPLQGYRAGTAAAPRQETQQQQPGGGGQQQQPQQGQQVTDAAANVSSAAGPSDYSVTVRLRYR